LTPSVTQPPFVTEHARVRAGLCRFFRADGHHDPENAADEVIKRLWEAAQRPGLITNWDAFTVAVARNFALEERRRFARERRSVQLPVSPDQLHSDREHHLEQCFRTLSPDNRDLLIEYENAPGSSKRMVHEEMARQRNLSPGALAMRIHRIRRQLMNCVRNRAIECQ